MNPASSRPSHIDVSPRGVFCNRTLNMRGIRAVGCDMDYTLIHYDVTAWEQRAYEHVRARLRAQGLPVETLRFDAELFTRGLILDVELGNVIKANRFGYVTRAAHGTRMLSHEEQRKSLRADLGRPERAALGVPEHAVLDLRGLPVRAARRPAGARRAAEHGLRRPVPARARHHERRAHRRRAQGRSHRRARALRDARRRAAAHAARLEARRQDAAAGHELGVGLHARDDELRRSIASCRAA